MESGGRPRKKELTNLQAYPKECSTLFFTGDVNEHPPEPEESCTCNKLSSLFVAWHEQRQRGARGRRGWRRKPESATREIERKRKRKRHDEFTSRLMNPVNRLRATL